MIDNYIYANNTLLNFIIFNDKSVLQFFFFLMIYIILFYR